MAGQKFAYEAKTEPIYCLYLLDGFPGMVFNPQKGIAIEGEVWEVDDTCLGSLDRLEGTAEGLYTRVRVRLDPPVARPIIETYLYLKPVDGRTELGSRYDG